jgi:DNA uptake protein ComE-like DNA-binding protein
MRSGTIRIFELEMNMPQSKIRTAVLLLSVILFCFLVVRSPRNVPSISGNSPGPVIVELQGSIPKPGIYSLDRVKATISIALTTAGWSGTVPASLGDRKLTSGQSVTLLDNGGQPEITIGAMSAAARLAAGQKLDLNTASLSDLLLIPQMRANIAASIVKRREAKAWGSVDDLQELHGIGPKTSQKFQEYLEVVPR